MERILEPKEAKFLPNYEVPCINCGQTPTVDIYVNNTLENNMELCGPCCFGEANTLDPENW